jgi:sulfur relay (sulfurtransferase) complex TusBCD TusD component (DsrE family)
VDSNETNNYSNHCEKCDKDTMSHGKIHQQNHPEVTIEVMRCDSCKHTRGVNQTEYEHFMRNPM